MGERARDLAAQIMSEVDKLPNRASVSMAAIRFDSYQNAWWDIDTAYSYREPRPLNSIVRKEEWPYKDVVDAETGKMKQVLIKPSDYTCIMDNNQTVDNSTWWPGLPPLIEGKLLIGADLTDYPGKLMFNTYRPPPKFEKPSRKKADVSLWVDHIKALWPDPNEHDYFLDLCAHMVQRPAEKVNAIVVLSGEQGIGKDMALVPVKAAIGANNVRDISPDQFASPYNPWVKCIMLVINELRPAQEDYKASAMYDMLKQISVTPPDTIAVNDKYLRMQYVVNVLRIFITTNDMHSLYISPNDRRMMVLHSSLKQGWQDEKYFERMAAWFSGDGIAAVANYLADRDISKFKPKAKPFTTIGKQSIVNGWGAPDDAIGDALDRLKRPQAFFANELYTPGHDGADEIMSYLRQSRKLMHRMRRSGYFAVPFDPPLEFRGASRTIRFKTAFVQDALIREVEQYTSALHLRGTALAEEKVSMLHSHQPPNATAKGF